MDTFLFGGPDSGMGAGFFWRDFFATRELGEFFLLILANYRLFAQNMQVEFQTTRPLFQSDVPKDPPKTKTSQDGLVFI
jgi:hypothetical protein